MKVLWIGDAIIQSGFSIVTHNICNELCTKCSLEVFGIRYDGMARNPYPYYIYPAHTFSDYYSFNFAKQLVNKEKPDVVVVFNDDNTVIKYVNKIYDCGSIIIPMFPINLLPIDKNNILLFNNLNINNVITYTDFSKNKILEVNPNLKVTSIYHGVHNNVFFPIKDAKKYVGLDGKFVVGQVNTNTYRKRLDLFLIGFAEFAKDKSDVVCLIHSNNNDIAYDLVNIANDLNINDKVIFSNESVSFEKMNLIYNIMDINVNTSIGEGFGLSLLEGAACGVPVLCPNHGNLKNIWIKGADFIDIERREYVAGTNFVGDVISVDNFVNKLNKFYNDRTYLKTKSEESLEQSKSEKFMWKNVAYKVYKVLLNANKQKISYISS